MRPRKLLTRIHVWIGWIVGVQILLWVASGLFMTIPSIERVRGEHLRRPPAPIAIPAGFAPRLALVPAARPIKSLGIEMRLGRPFWVIRFADGGGALASPASGRLLPPIGARAALALALADYAGAARVAGVSRVDPSRPPGDYRRDEPAWQVRLDDGTNLYVDAGTGAVMMRRTGLWRAYDLMWGLHIMDWRGREDFNHPLLIGAAALSLASIMAGLVLLPFTIRRRRNRHGGSAVR
ncbi:hypothetical protein ABC347_09405 [Sphingomonas sp. 1P06PA]|uniref:hypothetical protein n=1 Tax=Sphingomonas sp. 1P06PA TaxID=554121 RepID=UPI0039A71D17